MRAWLTRLLGLTGRHADEALRQEIDTHLALQAEEFERRGMSRRDARDAALRAFGGVEKTTFDYRRQRGLPLVDTLSQDIRFACRVLMRDRGFAATAIAVLAIGIGVNNMMFTLIYGSTTLRGLPIERPDRVLEVSTFDQRFPNRALSYPEFDDLRRGARLLHRTRGVRQCTPRGRRPGPYPGAVRRNVSHRQRVLACRHRPHDGSRSGCRRRPARRAAGGDPRQPRVARPLLRRSGDSRPHDPGRRTAHHRHRRDARTIRFSEHSGGLAAAVASAGARDRQA